MEKYYTAKSCEELTIYNTKINNQTSKTLNGNSKHQK